MLFNNKPVRSVAPLVSSLLAVLLLLVACRSPAAESTPTPTPTPTPQPLAAQPFIDLGPDATLRQVVDRLPQDERTCVEDRIATDDPVWDQPAFRQDGVGPGIGDAGACFSNRSLTGLLVAGIYHQAGGLERQTIACIEGTFAGVDLAGIMDQPDEDASRDQVQQAFGSIVALLLCLTEEEAGRINLGEVTGGDVDLNLQDLRCVLQRVDVAVLTDFFTIADDPRATPSPEQMQRLTQLFQAFEACGLPTDNGLPGVP